MWKQLLNIINNNFEGVDSCCYWHEFYVLESIYVSFIMYINMFSFEWEDVEQWWFEPKTTFINRICSVYFWVCLNWPESSIYRLTRYSKVLIYKYFKKKNSQSLKWLPIKRTSVLIPRISTNKWFFFSNYTRR